MNRSLRHVVCALLAMLALTACQPDTSNGKDSAPAMSLKIYTVKPAQTQALRHALFSVLAGHSKVSSPAPGKLLVYAPENAQESISQVVATLEKSQPHSAPRQMVNVHFWVVDGIPGKGQDDAALDALAPALKPLRQSMGPLHFRLDGTASLITTAGGDWGMMSLGNGTTFKAKAKDSPTSRIDMQIVYNGPKNFAQAMQAFGSDERLHSLQTEVAAIPGQYIVLAQSPDTHSRDSWSTSASTASQPEKSGLRLLIMRVTASNTSH